MATQQDAKSIGQLQENMKFLSRYYQVLTEENFSEIYQYHFNQTPAFDRAGFRSAIDFFTTGSNIANAFGISRDLDNPHYNFKLTSCNYRGERPPVPVNRKLDSSVYDNREELPLRYTIYKEDFKRLWERSHRRRVVTAQPYNFIPFEDRTKELQLAVIQAENPENFVAHIRGDYYANWMEELMKNLKSFFHSSKNQLKYSITEYQNFLKEGQPCVVRAREIFWRAVINEVSPADDESNVLCLLVDHAEPVYVPKRDIFVIDKTFMALPMQAIQLRIDGVKSKLKKWGSSSKDYLFSDSLTADASTCYVKNKYADSLGVDLKHAGSDETVSKILIRKKFAVEDDTSSIKRALENIYYYPPCKAYAEILQKTNHGYVLDCVHLQVTNRSTNSASSSEHSGTRPQVSNKSDDNGGAAAFSAVPNFKVGDTSKSNSSPGSSLSGVKSATRIRRPQQQPAATSNAEAPSGFVSNPPEKAQPDCFSDRPRRNSLEGWGATEESTAASHQKVDFESQENAFDFDSIRQELSDMNEVQGSDSIFSRNSKAYQLLTPIILTYRYKVLECYFIPDQTLTMFIINGQNAFFSLQDRVKFTAENIDQIVPSEVVEVAAHAIPQEVISFCREKKLLTNSKLLLSPIWKTFRAIAHLSQFEDEKFYESLLLFIHSSKC